MLTILLQKKGFSALLCLFFLVTVGSCHLLLRIGGEGISADGGICFYWKEVEGNRDADTHTLYLCASFSSIEPDSGENFAVLLRFATDDAWHLSSAEGIMEDGELHVTVGDRGILLDGTLPVGEMVPLVRMKWKRSGEGSFSLRWRQTEQDRLYVQGRNGTIRDYGFSVVDVVPCPEAVTTHAVSTEGSTCTDREETCALTDATEGTPETEAWDTRDEASSESPSRDPEKPLIYLGCQETQVREGEYAVRLLFSGDRCPAIFVEGGGAICVDISRLTEVEIWDGEACLTVVSQTEEGFLACTFRHLRRDRTYTFHIISEEETLAVCYKDGEYVKTYRYNEQK